MRKGYRSKLKSAKACTGTVVADNSHLTAEKSTLAALKSLELVFIANNNFHLQLIT